MNPTEFRLNAFIARALGISRRKADEIVKGGEVFVRGEPALRPDIRLGREDEVFYLGQRLKILDNDIWILLNKPIGYITTKNDPTGRPIVMELLPAEYRGLFPVGRLDSSTTGVMLFTNDGKLAQKLLHPKFCVPREYRVEISGCLSEHEMALALQGVILDGKRARPFSMIPSGRSELGELWRVEFREGRYHEVRRFFAALGHEVKSLKRISFAGIELGKLTTGKWRLLADEEICSLKDRLEEYVKD